MNIHSISLSYHIRRSVCSHLCFSWVVFFFSSTLSSHLETDPIVKKLRSYTSECHSSAYLYIFAIISTTLIRYTTYIFIRFSHSYFLYVPIEFCISLCAQTSAPREQTSKRASKRAYAARYFHSMQRHTSEGNKWKH